MNQKEIENRSYLENNVNKVLEPLIVSLIKEKPTNVIEYMHNYLRENHGNRLSIHANERLELEFLTKDIDSLRQWIEENEQCEDDGEGEGEGEEEEESKYHNEFKNSDGGSENYSEESEEEDYLDELPPTMFNKFKGPRASVASESFGEYNSSGVDFHPPVVEKDEAKQQEIKEKLDNAFMFDALNEKEKGIVVMAMEIVEVTKGDVIIKEGDKGDTLYVIGEGEYKCTKVFNEEDGPTFLKEYKSGEAFGELALLYDAPRAATITADTDGVIYQLDRGTFNVLVKGAAAKRTQRYVEFLDKVKLLKAMDGEERAKLADAIKEEVYADGEYIIKEGESGNVFYFIEHGEATATKVLEPGKPPVQVMEYSEGDYFGERALIQNEPRAANVIAKGETTVVSLDRHSFKRMLGPIEEIMKRNMEIYKEFM